MPGQIRQWTPAELANFETFPLPVSGTVRLFESGEHRYILDCIDLSGEDLKRLENFHERMKGGFHPFRYKSTTDQFPHCHFGGGAVNFLVNGPNRCSVRFTIEALPPYTT